MSLLSLLAIASLSVVSSSEDTLTDTGKPSEIAMAEVALDEF
jgi:hypothetical protein